MLGLDLGREYLSGRGPRSGPRAGRVPAVLDRPFLVPFGSDKLGLFCSSSFQCHERGLPWADRAWIGFLPGQPFFLILPEPLKPIRRQRCIASGGLQVAMAEVVGQRTCVVTIIGEFVARAVPQHVRMNREW